MIDLFDDYEKLPNNVKKLVFQMGDASENEALDLNHWLAIFNHNGYTFEWGLSCEPYDLRLMTLQEKVTYMNANSDNIEYILVEDVVKIKEYIADSGRISGCFPYLEVDNSFSILDEYTQFIGNDSTVVIAPCELIANLQDNEDFHYNDFTFFFEIKGDIRNFTKEEFSKMLDILGQCGIDNFSELVKMYEERYVCKR